MLYALKDGVMLFNDDWLLVTASDAVCNFLPRAEKPEPGTHISAIFEADSTLGQTLARAIQGPAAPLEHFMTMLLNRSLDGSCRCHSAWPA